MTNMHRAEVSVEIGGARHVLRLTLGALAEIEAAYGVADLQALGATLGTGRISARDLITLLAAAMRGGGAQLSDSAVGAMIGAEDLPQLVDAIARLFALSFGEEGAGNTSVSRPFSPGNP